VEEKSNEIPAVRDLLQAFAGLAGAVVTIDAMHTQADTAQVILGRRADYVMTVKGNMPTLYRQLRRTVTKNGKMAVEVVYLITSDRDASPATLAAWVRGHWEIENRLHWVRDVTYQEDKSLVRTRNAPA
jgi:predicted transposase YbfD/YdcC